MKEKVVLLSLNSQWVNPIFQTHEKIYEVRKRAPHLTPPYDVYVYCTLKEPKIYYENKLFKGELNGNIIGKFTCTKHIVVGSPFRGKSSGTCLTDRQLAEYASLENVVFWEISDPIMFEQPIGIGCFGFERPPQSYCYMEVENGRAD